MKLLQFSPVNRDSIILMDSNYKPTSAYIYITRLHVIVIFFFVLVVEEGKIHFTSIIFQY